MTGRGVLVVGSSSDIGLAIGRAFTVHGDRVVGVSLARHEDPAFAETIAADCADPAAATVAVESAHHLLGRLDVVVLAAAAQPVAAAVDTTDAQWRAAVGATLDSAFFVARAALNRLPSGGAIVAVSSVNATLAAPGLPAYAAAKAGVEGLSRLMAVQLGPLGVRVNTIVVGTTATPWLLGRKSDAELDAMRATTLTGRIGDPDDVAATVAFLCSDAAHHIVGQMISVSGGQWMP